MKACLLRRNARGDPRGLHRQAPRARISNLYLSSLVSKNGLGVAGSLSLSVARSSLALVAKLRKLSELSFVAGLAYAERGVLESCLCIEGSCYFNREYALLACEV